MYVYVYIHIYIYILYKYLDLYSCAAKLRSRHHAICWNVAKQKSKYTIRNCITSGREEKRSQREPKRTKRNKMGAKGEPKGDQNGAKMLPKRMTSKNILCGTGAKNVEK